MPPNTPKEVRVDSTLARVYNLSDQPGRGVLFDADLGHLACRFTAKFGDLLLRGPSNAFGVAECLSVEVTCVAQPACDRAGFAGADPTTEHRRGLDSIAVAIRRVQSYTWKHTFTLHLYASGTFPVKCTPQMTVAAVPNRTGCVSWSATVVAIPLKRTISIGPTPSSVQFPCERRCGAVRSDARMAAILILMRKCEMTSKAYRQLSV